LSRLLLVLKHSPVKPVKQLRFSSPCRSPRHKQKSVGDYCLIWLFASLVIVHLWIYKFFFLILPVPIVFILIKKLGTFHGPIHTYSRCCTSYSCTHYSTPHTLWALTVATILADAAATPPCPK